MRVCRVRCVCKSVQKTYRQQNTLCRAKFLQIRITDLGIAVGSAVKTAQIHNVDNRVMYSAGAAALEQQLLDRKCTVAYGIPLRASGKNIFFDRQTER